MPDNTEPQGTRTLVRPDGSTLVVPDSDVDKLMTLGYREQTGVEGMERGIAEGIHEHYTSGPNKLKALGAGFASGFIPGSSLLFNENELDAMRHNPGLSLGAEVVGGLLMPIPGGSVANVAKEGVELGRGAKTLKSIGRGAAEGALFNTGAEINNAQLNGDPITVETIGAGIGPGALIGGALTGIGEYVGNRLEARAAKKLAEKEGSEAAIGVAEQHALTRADAAARVHAVKSDWLKQGNGAIGAMEDGTYEHVYRSLQDASNHMEGVIKGIREGKHLENIGLEKGLVRPGEVGGIGRTGFDVSGISPGELGDMGGGARRFDLPTTGPEGLTGIGQRRQFDLPTTGPEGIGGIGTPREPGGFNVPTQRFDEIGGIGQPGVDLATHGPEGIGAFPSPRGFDLPTTGIEGIAPFERAPIPASLEEEVARATGEIRRPKFDLRPMKAAKDKVESQLLDAELMKEVRPQMRAAQKHLAAAMDAAAKGESTRMAERLEKFREQMIMAESALSSGQSPKALKKLADDAEKVAGVARQYESEVAEAAAGARARYAETTGKAGKLEAENEKALREGMYRHQKRGIPGKPVAEGTETLDALVKRQLSNVPEDKIESIVSIIRDRVKAGGKATGEAGQDFGALAKHLAGRPVAEGGDDMLGAIIRERLQGKKATGMSKEGGEALDAIIKHQLSGLTPELTDATAGIAKFNIDRAARAADQITSMAAVQDVIKRLPKTAEGFASMTPKTMENLTAAVDELGKIRDGQFAGIQSAIREEIKTAMGVLGITAEGTPGTQLAALWKTMKEGRNSRAKEEMDMLSQGNLLWNKRNKAADRAETARYGAITEKQEAERRGTGPFGHAAKTAAGYAVGSWAADKVGAGGYVLGAGLTHALLGMKGSILGAIKNKIETWAPKAARGLNAVGSRVEPLATRIDGTFDAETRDRRKLMEARAKDITEMAPSIRDTLYKSLEPLGMKHPELAAGLHAQEIKRFQFILSKLPKDPGLAFSGLQSIWKPDPVAIEKFARYYDVYQNPVGVMMRALETGKITMEEVEGLREMNPEIYSLFRSQLIERIADPKIRKQMKYEDQVHMGIMLNMPFHGTMTPQFISAQQQMFTERNKPLEMNPRIQPGGGAGRPSGPGPSATSAQRSTEH